MNIPDLKTALNEGIVLFQFIKKDGTTRHARGTTCPDLVPADRTASPLRPPDCRLLRHRQKGLAIHAHRHHLVVHSCPQTLRIVWSYLCECCHDDLFG